MSQEHTGSEVCTGKANQLNGRRVVSGGGGGGGREWCFFFNDTATTEIYTLSLHDALPIWLGVRAAGVIVVLTCGGYISL